jgi:hypothetical protein
MHNIVGSYNEQEHYAMDLEFILKVALRLQIHYVNETWGNYLFIENTKTYDDQSSGIHKIRKEAIFNAFQKKLPYWSQLRIAVSKKMFKVHIYLRRCLYQWFGQFLTK